MKNAICIGFVLAGFAVSVTGCATVSHGSTQTIEVGSKPDGAECTFTRAGAALGSVVTPGPIKVSRSSTPINVLCTKAGYEEARAVLNSRTRYDTTSSSSIVGAVVAVGALVDMTSGANISYESALMVTLDPK
jgi:hypothetical protein